MPAPVPHPTGEGKRRVGKVKRAALQAAGAAFIGIGIPGLLVPFIQGALFIAIGLALLTTYNERINRVVHTRIERLPWFQRLVKRAEGVITRMFGNP